MKNKSSFKPLRWLLDVVPKGIAVFAIAAGAYYAYAAITFPGVAPYTVTGVVGQFVGLSTGGFDASVTDYKTLNDKCRTNVTYSGSHVCGPMEIINSYNFNSSVITAQSSGTGIINTGPPGFTVFANDCNGWSVRTSTYLGSPAFGSVWSFANKSGSLASCDSIFGNASVQIACCK